MRAQFARTNFLLDMPKLSILARAATSSLEPSFNLVHRFDFASAECFGFEVADFRSLMSRIIPCLISGESHGVPDKVV